MYSRAPADCLQYLTGVSNSFKSFNFGNLMIRNLQYDVCIRPESGYCRFQLLESSSTTDSFKIDPASTTTTSKVKLSLSIQGRHGWQGPQGLGLAWISGFRRWSGRYCGGLACQKMAVAALRIEKPVKFSAEMMNNASEIVLTNCEKKMFYLVTEKNFWNSRLKAENLQKFWDH